MAPRLRVPAALITASLALAACGGSSAPGPSTTHDQLIPTTTPGAVAPSDTTNPKASARGQAITDSAGATSALAGGGIDCVFSALSDVVPTSTPSFNAPPREARCVVNGLLVTLEVYDSADTRDAAVQLARGALGGLLRADGVQRIEYVVHPDGVWRIGIGPTDSSRPRTPSDEAHTLATRIAASLGAQVITIDL